MQGERWQWVKLPTEWTSSGTKYTSMGAIGYVRSGGTVFDHRSSPFGDLASCHEWISLDPSHGHSDPSKQYHYHGVRLLISVVLLLNFLKTNNGTQYIIPFQKQDCVGLPKMKFVYSFYTSNIDSRASISTSYEPPDVVKEVKGSIEDSIDALK